VRWSRKKSRVEAMRGAISLSSQGAVTSTVLLRMMLRFRPAISRSLRSLSAAAHTATLSDSRHAVMLLRMPCQAHDGHP
jgi:hypothetical protein